MKTPVACMLAIAHRTRAHTQSRADPAPAENGSGKFADAVAQLRFLQTKQSTEGNFDQRSRLERKEQALRICMLWLWLDNRIKRQLKGRRPLWQRRGR